MIARELLVKLGFDIDESKFNRFTQNVENLKSSLSGIKSKIGLNIDNEKLNQFKQQVGEVKAKISNVQGQIGLNLDNKKLSHFTKQVDEVKAKISGAQGQIGLNINDEKLKSTTHTIAGIKAQMTDLRKEINKRIYPKIDLNDLAAYRQELAALPKGQRQELLALNKIEKEASIDQLKVFRSKYAQLQLVKTKLAETQQSFNAAARTAKSANMAFSRFFTRFAIIGTGSALLSIRKTLKDAEDFKAGGAKTNNHFSREQLDSVHRFNVSLKQLGKTTGELRNRFVIGLLPAFKTNIDLFNAWMQTNKKMIDTKIQKFIDTLASALKILASAIGVVFSILNPLVDLIGGWGVVLSGIIGVGIISWLVRLGMFLGSGATAIAVFATAIKTLSVALISNPIVWLIMGIVGALVLIADEFIVTAQGGDSLINRFGGLKKICDSFIETLKEMWQWLVKVGEDMLDFRGISALKDFVFGDDKQKSNLAPQALLSKSLLPNIPDYGKLNISDSLSERFQLSTPSSINYHNAQAQHNNSKSVKNNNTFNLSINVPKGTSEEQSKIIAREIKKQIQTEREFNNEKTLNAIGGV